MSICEGIEGYHRIFGLRGPLALSAYHLFGWPRELTVQKPGVGRPVHLRIRTSDVSTFSEILLRNEYAFDLPLLPRTIVDAGANIGMASIYFAHRYPEAKIIAVEAEASNYAMLRKNTRHYPAITPIHGALWKCDGEISVQSPKDSNSDFGKWGFVTHEGTGTKTRAMTMRTLMREMNIQVIDLAKIDIEGAEMEVFEDRDWLSATKCLMIELHDRFRPGCSEMVEAAMREFDREQRGETVCFVRKKLDEN